MRRDLYLLAVVRKQNVADDDTSQKHYNERHTDYAPVPWRTRTYSPQLLVQKFLVTLVHFEVPYEPCEKGSAFW